MNFITQDIIEKHFFDDLEMFIEVSHSFIAEYPKFIESIQIAIKDQDSEAARTHSHKLAGALSTFRIDELHGMAVSLEALATENTFEEFQETYSKLTKQVELLILELGEISKKGTL